MTVVNLKYLTERNTEALSNIWVMWISMSSVCRLYRMYFYRRGKKLRALSFSYEWCTFSFLKKKILKNFVIILPSFFIRILHHNLSRKHFIVAKIRFFSTYLFNRNSFSWDHFALTSYISISRQFTEDTWFEFLLHLVTLNWT